MLRYFRLSLIFMSIALPHVPSVSLAAQHHAQFCWAIGKFDQTIYFAEAEDREDRQASFDQLLDISGIDHHPTRCHVMDASSYATTRAVLMKEWLESEFEVVDTTFMSDLDY